MMGHKKWESNYAWDKRPSEQAEEHNALYDAWEVERDRATDMLDENNRLDRELDEAKKQLKVERDRAGDLLKDRNAIQGKLDEARKRIAELESPTRVPFSDAQIDAMADAACDAGGGIYELSNANKRIWQRIVRAALAAGGLEPCAPPEYDPADVALTPSDDEVEKLARVLREAGQKFRLDAQGKPKLYQYDDSGYQNDMSLWEARAAFAHLRPTQGHVLRDRLVEARRKVENQRVELATFNNLRQLDAGTRGALMSDISNAVRNAMERLPDAPWRDKTATEAVWLLSLAVSGAEQNVADLRAQLDALHPGETVTSILDERDHYRVQLEREQERVRQYKQDRDDAVAELAAMRERAEQAEAERDDLQYENPIIRELRAILGLEWGESITQRCKELAALRQRESVPVKVRFDVTAEEADDFHLRLQDRSTETVEDTHDLMDYLAAHAVIDAPAGVRVSPAPTDAEIEALARVLHKEANQNGNFPKPDFEKVPAIEKDRLLLLARAAVAHLAKRAEGLPTAEELRAAHMQYAQDYEAGKNDGALCATDFALDYLRPWLRDPAGWELDVHPDQLELYKWVTEPDGGYAYAAQQALDLCRSRIRPVFECKECAEWKATFEEQSNRVAAARAALEGE